MAINLQSILIPYWQRSPNLRRVVGYKTTLRDEALAAARAILEKRDCGRADGIWLDLLGGLLGLDRPVVRDPAQDVRFGFDAAGVAFDQAPFAGSEANEARFPLPGSVYCLLLQARGVTLLADGTLPCLRRALSFLDPTATAVDNRDGTITITTRQVDLVNLAIELDALPLSLGVIVTVVDVTA